MHRGKIIINDHWSDLYHFLTLAFHISYYDVIEALNLKINAIFEEGTSKYPMLPNFVLLP